MKKTLKNSLFDKKRFEWMEEEKKKWLQNLTLEESIRMTEEFLSSRMFEKFRDRFTYTEPVCFKLGLKRRKENVRKRI
jgi:hypothetical protein